MNKVDLWAPSLGGGPDGVAVYGVSVKTGAGMGELLSAIGATAATSLQSGAMPVITRARHREALRACADALATFEARTDRLGYPEIAGEDLRIAVRALARITGRVDVEDLLDVIFRDFCIGK